MPLLLLLPYFPLTTVLMSCMCIFASEIDCMNFECTDIVQDVADCDVCWCYEEGGFGCFCCTVCRDSADAYAKKS
jgi:hypothetical protein